jgi:PBP1b-binding outer membrane lipoprotein LpoB
MKRKLFGIVGVLAVLLALGLILAGCASYQPVDVTNTMAAQINNMKFHEVQPGEKVNTMYIDRTGSLAADINKYEDGVWYNTHKDKIVSIEAVREQTSFVYATASKDKWRVEYVD